MQGIFIFALLMEDFTTQKAPQPQFYSRQLPNATATLVLGIVSIVICFPGFITGIIGIVLHKKDRALYLSDPQTYEQSYKTARAGYICSIVGLCLSVAVIIFYTFWFIMMFSMVASFAPHNY